MSSEAKTEDLPKRKRNWAMTLFKVALVVVALVFAALTILANMGGASDNLKASVEGFVAQNTGYPTVVRKLNRMTFFPRISLDVENVELYREMPGVTAPVVTAEKVQLSLSFWDVFFANGKIQVFNVVGLVARPGVLTDRQISIKRMTVTEAGGGRGVFTGEGTIGVQPLSFSMAMEIATSGGMKAYKFAEIRDSAFKLGNVAVSFSMVSADDGLALEQLNIERSGQKVLSGRLIFLREPLKTRLQGEILMAEHQSDIKPDINLSLEESEPFFAGTLSSGNFHLEDFAPSSGFAQTLKDLQSYLGDSEIISGLSFTDPDVTLKLAHVYESGQEIGSYDGYLLIDKGQLDTKALAAAIRGSTRP